VKPGQPLLSVSKTSGEKLGILPLVTKGGFATHVMVSKPKSVPLSFVIYDATSKKEKRLAGVRGEIVGQPNKKAISDRSGRLHFSEVNRFGDYPLYLDLSSGK